MVSLKPVLELLGCAGALFKGAWFRAAWTAPQVIHVCTKPLLFDCWDANYMQANAEFSHPSPVFSNGQNSGGSWLLRWRCCLPQGAMNFSGYELAKKALSQRENWAQQERELQLQAS